MLQAIPQGPSTLGGRLEVLPLSELTPDPQNPRVHRRGQIAAIAKSIQVFGFNAPILVDSAKRIVAGHGRYEAAKSLGLPKVPVIRLDHLTDEQAKAYRLADNKLTDRSNWDDNRVAEILKELSGLALSFDIDATGFEMPEVDLRIQSLASPELAEDEDDEDASGASVISQPGDLWILGDHRVYCGSALEAASLEALLGDQRAAAIFTDPPYNVKIDGHVTGNGKKKHREFAMASGEMTPDQFSAFLEAAFRLMLAYCEEAVVAYACMDWRHLREILTAIAAVECEIVNVCIWVKSNAGMGGLYRSMHEFVFVFGRPGAARPNNVQLGKYGRNRTNVWNYPGMSSFARRGSTRGIDLHPTVKPLAMVADAIMDVTKRGSIVLDPFCGSGTTIIAAERTGRRGYGLELDPGYVDTAVRRWQKMTKKSAIHSSGRTFEEIAVDRRAANVEEG